MLKKILAATAALACAGVVYGFGSVNFMGQHAEHEKITRTALGCHANNAVFVKEGSCFQAKSLDEIAGKTGTFGAVAAPDNPLNGELGKSEAHCDNSKLLECRAYMNAQMNLAVAEARALLDRDGKIEDSQIPNFISCTYLRQKGRAKCAVLEHLGSALHAAQDFYAHSNWVDEAAPGPITIGNPRGLDRAEIAPFLNIRYPFGTVPAGLISGCFIQDGPLDTKGNAKCTVTSHEDLNKDKGVIDPERFNQPGDPTLTTATTARGKIGTNFHKAVAGAVLDTRDKIRIFKERLIAAYGPEKGALMFCATTHDNPKASCPVGSTPTAPNKAGSGCPAGFKWVGGYMCAAYNVTKAFCDRNNGRYIPSPVQRAPTRCEVTSN